MSHAQISPDQRRAIVAQVLSAIIETVKEAGPLGAPAGVLYAAMNARGMTYDQFTQVMGTLVVHGKLTWRNHCYHAV